MAASFALSNGQALAAVNVQLSPSAAAPQPVGTTVVWTASANSTNPGALVYHFSVRPAGGDFAIVRDYAHSNSFEWTPSDREGVFDIRVIVVNISTGETAQLAVSYSVSPRVTGNAPVISGTANPLVALYSAPACAAGSMRVRFWRTGDFTSDTTPWKSCRPGVSMNFYLAGMLAATQYSVRHEVSSDPDAPVEPGPTLSFMTGTPPAGFFPNRYAVTAPPSDSEQDVLLHSYVLLNFDQPLLLSATDLSGRLLWYYERRIQYATQPCAGGTMLTILDSPGAYDTLREIDLAGNTVRETNINAVSELLRVRGEQGITHFHHDARCLPDGKTIVLAGAERTLSDVQGPGPVNILGDVLVVLDENWQVIWSWNAFDHLDVTRKALLDEKCTRNAGCVTSSPAVNDWTHSNSVSYVPSDGNLLLSVRHMDWVVKIDYRDGSGTGAVLWRLGKDGDFTIDSDDPYPWFSHQHDAVPVPGENQTISIYDNGNTRQLFPNATPNSRGQVYVLDEANRTASLQLNADLGAYSFALGSGQRLSDGRYHFLSGFITPTRADSIEVRPDGTTSFTLRSEAPTYRSFRMRDLYTPGNSASGVGEESQTLSFDAVPEKTYGDAPFDLNATATSGLPVGFRVVSGPATVSGNTVTITGAGNVILQADQYGNIRYGAARSVRQSFAVKKANQAITFNALPNRTFGDADFALTASASSGLAVTFSAAGQCAVSGSTVQISGAGACTVTASQPGDGNYTAATNVSRTFQVAQGGQSITFAALSNKTFGDPDFALSASASSGLAVTFSASGVCTLSGSTLHLTGAGTCTVTASQPGSGNYTAAADVVRSFQVAKAGQTITFNDLAGRTFGDPDFAVNATASSGLAVSFSATGACTVTGGTVRLTGAGSCTVTASQGGDSNFDAAADVSRSFTVAKVGQSITFAALSNKTYGDAPFNVSATATSRLPVSFSVVSGPANISGDKVTITGAGTITVRASQAGDGNHNAAPDVQQSFTSGKAGSTTLVSVVNATYDGQPHGGSASVNGVGGLSQSLTVTYSGRNQTTYSSTTPPTNAGDYTASASFDGGANHTGSGDSKDFQIAKAGQAVTFNALPNRTFGDADFALTASASSGLPITFSASGQCAVSGSTVHIEGAGTCTVTASQPGSGNYTPAADVVRSFQIAKAGQTITFDALPGKTFGDPDFALSASASSGLAVTFTASGVCTLSGPTLHLTGAGTCTVTASQPGSGNYTAAADVVRSFQVAKAGQTITFNDLAGRTFGDPDFAVNATASSGLAVSFSATGACTVTGGTVRLTGAGSCTVTASQGGDSNFSAAADVSRSFTVAKVGQSITFAALSNKSFGDPDFTLSASASSGLAVTFTASGVCTLSGSTVHIDGAGACTVTASQPGDENYKAATPVERSFNVAKVGQSITFDALTDKTYGDAPFNVSASGGASGNPVTFSASGNCTAGGTDGATVTITGAGSCTVTASQAGDGNYTAASDVSHSFSISKAATTTSLSSSANPSAAGQGLTLTATVNSPAGTPDGTVQFKVNGESLGAPVALNAGGVASLTAPAQAAGSYTVTAEYGGGANFNASSGALGGVQVVGGVFEFSLPLYSVAEGGGSVTIRVRRAGDVSTAASVGYATDDGSTPAVSVPCSSVTGLALGRCDYTGAAGRLDFAAGEAEKTFVVLVNDDSFVEGTETTRVRLFDASGGNVLGSLPSAALEITDDELESEGNPSDDNEAFVRQHYHDFLGRAPDAEGLKFWTDGIKACGPDGPCREVKRVHTSAAFFLSIEFQNTGFFAYRMHKAASGDEAGRPVPLSFEDFIGETRELGREVVVGQAGWEQRLAANKAAYALRFVQRPEFLARYPAQLEAAAFVEALNANGGGVLTDAEKSSLVSELSQNPADASLRASVLRKVAENASFARAETSRALVLMQYFGYLRRDPDAAPDADFSGFNFWLSKLNEFDGDFIRAEMVKAFINSTEYRKRFGQ